MNQIKNLLKRNMPVFIIGGVTVLIFLLIILLSQKNPPADQANLIEVSQDDLISPHTYVKGPSDAPVTLVEFTDFGCPACKAYQPVVHSILNDYPNLVRLAIRHFPLPIHKNSFQAAVAAQAAGEQDKFWEYGDLLFENQGSFTDDDLVKYADFLGMDVNKFKADYKNKTIEDIVNQDVSFGNKIGINATPTYFLNGKQLKLTSVTDLRTQVEQALKDSGIDLSTTQDNQTGNQVSTDQTSDTQQDSAYAQVQSLIDDHYGTLKIDFTDNGFTPRNTQVYAGQKVVWTNTTDNDITFVQLMPKFDSLSKPFVIAAGDAFEFRIPYREEGLYTYKQEGSDTRASIMINKLPQALMDLLPDSTSQK